MRTMKTLASFLVPFALTMTAQAQEYPTRIIKLMHGFPPGGNVEFVARLLANEMQKNLGQTIVIESKPGQAGSLAAETLAAAEPDGHTLLLVVGRASRNRRRLQKSQIRSGGQLFVDLHGELLSIHPLRAQRLRSCAPSPISSRPPVQSRAA